MDTTAAITIPSALPWYKIWWKVLTHPSVRTFDEIRVQPGVHTGEAYEWILVAGLLAAIVTYGPLIVRDQPIGGLNHGLSAILIISPLFQLLILGLLAGAFHLISQRIFQNPGNLSQLIFCLAASTAPVMILSSVIDSIPAGISTISSIADLVSFLLGSYNAILYMLALQSVYKLTAGKSCLGILLSAFVIIPYMCIWLVIYGALNPDWLVQMRIGR